MGHKRIAIVLGTRPEGIKMAPVYLAMKKDPGFDVRLLATAQHRPMLDQALSVFGIDAAVSTLTEAFSSVPGSVACGRFSHRLSARRR